MNDHAEKKRVKVVTETRTVVKEIWIKLSAKPNSKPPSPKARLTMAMDELAEISEVVSQITFHHASSTSLGAYFVTRKAGVCGGAACVQNTRIPVWVLYRAHKRGDTNAKLRREYPVLKKFPLVEILKYAKEHSTEIDGDIKANRAW